MAAPAASASRTLLFETVSSRLLIAVYGSRTPSNAEWAEYRRALEGLGEEVNVLAFSSGGGPSLTQRRQLEDAIDNRPGRAAIVTIDRIARGIVTAIRWFNHDIKAFEPSQWEQALEFLSIDATTGRDVMRRLKAMAEELGNAAELGL